MDIKKSAMIGLKMGLLVGMIIGFVWLSSYTDFGQRFDAWLNSIFG